jgi:hypothetical protein
MQVAYRSEVLDIARARTGATEAYLSNESRLHRRSRARPTEPHARSPRFSRLGNPSPSSMYTSMPRAERTTWTSWVLRCETWRVGSRG